jgi:hypothetical protein
MMQLWQKHAIGRSVRHSLPGPDGYAAPRGLQLPASPAACLANLRLSAVQRAAF